jgi:hypothetical protein
MKTFDKIVNNVHEFPSTIYYRGDIYEILFDDIDLISDNTISVDYKFLKYKCKKTGTVTQFDKNGINGHYCGLLVDYRTKYGRKIKKFQELYKNKDISLQGEI